MLGGAVLVAETGVSSAVGGHSNMQQTPAMVAAGPVSCAVSQHSASQPPVPDWCGGNAASVFPASSNNSKNVVNRLNIATFIAGDALLCQREFPASLTKKHADSATSWGKLIHHRHRSRDIVFSVYLTSEIWYLLARRCKAMKLM